MSTLEDLEVLETRRKDGHISNELLRLSEELSETEPVLFGTFHAYEEE